MTNPKPTAKPAKKAANIATTSGAIYEPVHVGRKVRVIPIQEHELQSIGMCNSAVSLWCSLGSIAATLILSALWDIYTSGAGESKNALPYVLACVVAAIFSFGMARHYYNQKGTTLDAIKAETIEEPELGGLN